MGTDSPARKIIKPMAKEVSPLAIVANAGPKGAPEKTATIRNPNDTMGSG